jgi:hypothetical protein
MQVQTFVCPEIVWGGPGKGKRKAIADAGDSILRKKASGSTEIKDIMHTIREFSSTTLTGLAKHKHKDDKLVKLGALPKKQQTMPLKMALGIKQGREKRLLKAQSRAKESGLVLSSSPQKQQQQQQKDARFDKGGAPDIDVRSRKGVFHLSKQRIPDKLINKGKAAAAAEARGRGKKGGTKQQGRR